MEIYTTLADVPPLRPAAALGNFDGLHQGHRRVIALAQELGRTLGAPTAVMTFSPHPRQVLCPEGPPFRLLHPVLQEEQLRAMGVDMLLRLPFTKDFAALSAKDFAHTLLHQALGVRGVVCGYDFLFGHHRTGNTKFLERLGDELGFSVRIAAPEYGVNEHLHSSSAIRQALRQGRSEEVMGSLGQPWTILGTVIPGAQRGRTIGFPTANIAWDAFPYVQARHGVYAVEAAVGQGPWRPGVANLGMRPTVGGVSVLLETHVLGASGDWYGQAMRVRFLRFIREEQRFAGIEALKAQIALDIQAAHP